MEEKQEFGIYIGRFQPLHNAHLASIQNALSKVKKLIIIIGSAGQAKTPKNPWTAQEREGMVRSCLSDEDNNRVNFIYAKDYLYRDNVWLSSLQSSLSKVGLDDVSNEGQITLFGHDKDRSTYYLHLFPMWKFEDTGSFGDIDATRVRSMLFTGNINALRGVLPSPVFAFLKPKYKGDQLYQRYTELEGEYQYIQDYKKQWEKSPYPPIFVTTDAVVIKSGHVLIVKRAGYPGKGLLSLPGGCLEQNERIINGLMRELKEETQIDVSEEELRQRIVDQKVFDHPDRSLRGRTITHSFCIDLGSGRLPKVKGADDADPNGTGWMPLRDVFSQEDQFFEDHFHIVDYFVQKF